MDNKTLSNIFRDILTLRWSPVAVRLLRPGEEVPAGMTEPAEPLRYCQSIIAARRGHHLYMPPHRHSCPDGTGILGLVEMSDRLRSGELYLLFKKLPDLKTAQEMIAVRPEFPAGTFTATLVAPLEEANYEPDVVIFTLLPEQAMWICSSATYAGFGRQNYQTSSYNSNCAYLTVQVMQNNELNMSFGDYGGRAASEIGDDEVYLSVPYGKLPAMAAAIKQLAKKSIPEERRKIYLFPQMGQMEPVGSVLEPVRDVTTNPEKCIGCGLCVAFCPEYVLELTTTEDGKKSQAVRPEKCTGCYTCVGQCPQQAIHIIRGEKGR